MFEFKLALKYLRQNKIESISIIVCLIISITLILGVDIGVNTLHQNQIKMAKEIAGFYEGTLTTNNEKNIEKLKQINGVYNVQTVKNLGEFVPENGLKTKLYTFNEGYLKSLNYKLIQGRFPKNKNEILIDTHSLSKFSNHDILNKEISGLYKIHYKLDGVNKLFSEKSKYKVVGLISKEDKYYELQNNIINGNIDILTFIKTSKTILPSKLTDYNTLFNIKDVNEKNLDEKFEYIRQKYDSSLNSKIDIRKDNNSEISDNEYLDATLRLYKDQMGENNIEIKIFLTIISIFLIANVLYISIKKLINQISQLRVIGMSNKKVIKFYLIQTLILFIIGAVLGVISSIIFAKFSLSIFTVWNMFEVNDFDNIKLNMPYFMIVRSLLIILSVLLIILFLLIRNSLKRYPIEILNVTDKVKYRTKKNKKLLLTLLKNNLFRNTVKTTIPILIIAFSGFMIISTFSNNLDYIIKQERQYSGSSGNKFDYVISHYYNVDKCVKKIDVSKIKCIKEVKDIDILNYNEGNLIEKKIKLNNSYINTLPLKYTNSTNIEIPTSVVGIDNINYIKKYVKEGNIEKLFDSQKEYINIAINNSFYDDVTGEYKPSFKNLKLGDIINLKIESKDNSGKSYYNNVKCKVVLKLDESFKRIKEINSEPDMRITMSLENLKQIANNNYVQRVGINIDKNGYSKVNKSIKDMDNDNDFLRIFDRQLEDAKDYKVSYYLLVMLLVLISALISIYMTISLNFKNNIKEFSILRAIGIPKKTLKKLVIYESIIYPFIGSIISIIFISSKDLKYINIIKEINQYIYIKPIYIPPKEGFVFMSIVILFAFLIGYIKSKSIDKMEIIEGINKN